MIQIRKGVFETNSSSTHSIAIPRSSGVPSYISFYTGEFGWAFEEVDAANYFYTAIYEVSETMAEVEERIEKLKSILDSHSIEYKFNDPRCEEHNGYLSFDGYIDHGYELRHFVDELLDDGDKLVRLLDGGLVFTGNDNSDSMGFVERDREFIYDWDSRANVKNEYYMANHDEYEWYDK